VAEIVYDRTLSTTEVFAGLVGVMEATDNRFFKFCHAAGRSRGNPET
jgi:hypothetical protein